MNYLTDAESFARDLTEAADAQDWTRYRNIQAQLAAETSQAILAQAVQADQGRRAAISEVTKSRPGFDVFRESDSYRRILAEHKTLARAIEIAENSPSAQGDLPELYKLVSDCAKVDQASHPQHRQATNRQEIRGEFTPSPLAEENIFRATEAAKRIDLSPRNRKTLIAELESHGVADIEEIVPGLVESGGSQFWAPYATCSC